MANENEVLIKINMNATLKHFATKPIPNKYTEMIIQYRRKLSNGQENFKIPKINDC